MFDARINCTKRLFWHFGGLDLGFKAAGYKTVCYIEREPYAQAVLLDRMQDGLLDAAPIWSDFQTFDGHPWRGVVDCFVAGIPCQGNSLAGKRRGEEDERNLWPDMRRITSEVEPAVVVVENVPGLFAGPQAYGFRVVGELQQLGYVVLKRTLSARAVGAPHRRDRVFIIGVRTAPYSDGVRRSGEHDQVPSFGRYSEPFDLARTTIVPAYSDSRYVEAHGSVRVCSNVYGAGQGEHSASVESSETQASNSVCDGAQGSVEEPIQRLPDFQAFENIGSVEELFGRSDVPEPLVRRGDDGIPYYVDRIKALGNAVVPQVAFQIAREIQEITRTSGGR